MLSGYNGTVGLARTTWPPESTAMQSILIVCIIQIVGDYWTFYFGTLNPDQDCPREFTNQICLPYFAHILMDRGCAANGICHLMILVVSSAKFFSINKCSILFQYLNPNMIQSWIKESWQVSQKVHALTKLSNIADDWNLADDTFEYISLNK